MLLEGKTAIVTGASGGIGKAVAIALAKEGAAVAVHFHGNEEKALLVKKEIEEAGGKAEIFRANVADFEECNALVKGVAKTFGSIDILVNNAGITKDGLLMAMSEADFDNVIDTNLKGCFQMIRFASRRMMKQRYGRIINVSSVSGVAGKPRDVNYDLLRVVAMCLVIGVHVINNYMPVKMTLAGRAETRDRPIMQPQKLESSVLPRPRQRSLHQEESR